MISGGRTLIVIIVAVCAGALACTNDPASDPADQGGRSRFPQRPAAIDLAAVPPCGVLTKPQQAQLGIYASQAGDVNVDGRPSPGCGYLSSDVFDYNTQTIPVGADAAIQLPGSEVIHVNGFGAVRNRPDDSFSTRPTCQVAIDAAPGQTIRVQVSTAPNGPPVGEEQLCSRATDVASMVMDTVVAATSR